LTDKYNALFGFTYKTTYLKEKLIKKNKLNHHSLDHIYKYYSYLLLNRGVFYHFQFTFVYSYKQLKKFN
jgi:hypothetical protein